jgi:hypothetical protein
MAITTRGQETSGNFIAWQFRQSVMHFSDGRRIGDPYCCRNVGNSSLSLTKISASEGQNNKKDRWSRQGLGHLLNPSDPEASDPNWTAAVWEMIIWKGCGLKGICTPTRHRANYRE